MKTISAIAVATVVVLSGITVSLFNTPCATEDSTSCHWDGNTRGNKTGQSYLFITDTISIRTK